MNADAIVNDIFEELPLFAKIHRLALIHDYLSAHHLALFGIVVSIVLKVI